MARNVTVRLIGQSPFTVSNCDRVADVMDQCDVPHTYTAMVNGVDANCETELGDGDTVDLAKNIEGGSPF